MRILFIILFPILSYCQTGLIYNHGKGVIDSSRVEINAGNYDFYLRGKKVVSINKDSSISIYGKNIPINLKTIGDSLYAVSNDSLFLLTARQQMGAQHLLGDTTTLCDTVNTYKKIIGRFGNGVNNNFTLDGKGKITFTGIKGTVSIINGVSDVTADKTCQIKYALYKNGSLYTGAETPIDINNPSKSKSISITMGLGRLKSGDYFEVYCKSDVSNTTITHNTLMLTFICDR